MVEIPLPAHSVVLIVGGRRAPLAEVADRVPASAAAPWNVQKPDASLELLHGTLGTASIVRVCMADSNGKARRAVASAAHRRGMRCICIRLPGAAVFDAADERIDTAYDIAAPGDVSFRIVPMPSDRTELAGPFDIVGDVHGCRDELMELLGLLGHLDEDGEIRRHPDGRIPVLLGDLTDRGPDSKGTLEIARRLTEIGGIVIRGNHDDKLHGWLRGKDVEVKAGLDMTIQQLSDTTQEWRLDMAAWIGTLESHLMLDGGRLAVAHAGIDEEHQGRHTRGAWSMGLYGRPVKGGTELDEHGFPLREDWALTYAGSATVVHGHVVHDEPRIVGNVVAIDTGCVHGGRLTAYRWPEREFVSVQARAVHFARAETVEADPT